MTPRTNRNRIAFSRATPTAKGGAGNGKTSDEGDLGGSGGKRILGTEGLGIRGGVSYGRRLG
jgi:hypothetical protein